MTAPRPLVRRRAILLCGVALGLTSPGAWAQEAPGGASAVPVLSNSGGASIETLSDGMRIDAIASGKVVDWATFNLGSAARLEFTASGTTGAVTILNRVAPAGGRSEIYGSISASDNVSVWLSNPSGILVGPSGAFSGGSFVLTTGQINDGDDFINRVDAANAEAPGTVPLFALPEADIVVQAREAGATFTLNGSLIIAARQVAVSGVVQANGDVAFVAAESVTVPAFLGSPIKVTIAAGSPIARASVVVGPGGAITARNIVLAGAASNNGVDALLSLDSNARLTAATVGGKVVLIANAASLDDTVSITGQPSAPSVVAVDGSIEAGGAVQIRADGVIGNSPLAEGATRTLGAITSLSDTLTIQSAGQMTLGNDLTAGTTLTAGSNGIGAIFTGNLRAGLAANLSAKTDLVLGFTGGTLTAGSVSLTAGTRLGALGAYSVASTAGDITLAAPTIDMGQVGLNAGQRDLIVKDLTSIFSVGTIDARRLIGIDTAPADIFAQRITVSDALTLNTPGAIRIDEARSTGGSVTLTAIGPVTGRASETADGLAPGFGRTTISAGTDDATTTAATVLVTSDGVAQLGSVTAGRSGIGVDPALDQISVTAAGIDMATAAGQQVTAANGNIALTAGAGGLRFGTGTAAGAALLITGNDAQIGNLTTLAGDILLRVPGTLTGLLATGATAPEIVAGDLTLGQATGLLTLTSTGDLQLGSATASDATLRAGGNVRIGQLDATGAVSVDGDFAVTGIGTLATAGAGANLTASGSVLLPDQAAAEPLKTAVLGTVRAGENVSLRAASLSAQSIQAGGAVSVEARSGALIDAASAATVSVAVTEARPGNDSDALTVDGTGRLRGAFGLADIASTSTTAPLLITAGTAAQLGTVSIGDGDAPVAAFSGAAGQVRVSADSMVAREVRARNGSIVLSVNTGDLYLGSPALIDAGLTDVAVAQDRLILNKAGIAGLVIIAGAARAGQRLATSGDGVDDGLVSITSATGIAGRSITSGIGDVRLAAATRIEGLSGSATGGVGAPFVGANGDLVLGQADIAGAIDLSAFDMRIGRATSGESITLQASGSVTGLTSGGGSSGSYRPLDITAARAIAVGGLAAPADGLDAAVLGSLRAGTSVDVRADTISIGSVTAASLALNLTSLGGGASPSAYATDDPALQDEKFASAFGGADLSVTNAGSPASSTATGTISVNAIEVAQLGVVTAGAGATALRNERGLARDQITVSARGISATQVSATNGGVALSASAGGLYAGTIDAGLGAVLSQTGSGSFVGGNELRIRTISTGLLGGQSGLTSDLVLDSAGAMRIGTATSRAGSIRIGQGSLGAAPELTGLLRSASVAPSDGQILPGYDGAILSATGATFDGAATAFQQVVVTVGGAAKLASVSAGQGTVSAGTLPNQIAVTAGELDIGTAIASNGDLSLETTTGRLRLASGQARQNATLIAGTAENALASAEIGSLEAITGDVRVEADRRVTNLLSGQDGSPTIAAGLQLGDVQSDGDVTIDAAGNARLGSVSAVGVLAVTAGRSVTGAGGQSLTPASGVTLLKAGGTVTVGSVAGLNTLGLASIGRIEAAAATRVDAQQIAIGSVQAATTTLVADTALTLGTARGGPFLASTSSASAADAGATVSSAADGVLAPGFGGAVLTARNAASRPGIIQILADDVVQLASVNTGSAGDPLLQVNGRIPTQVLIAADAISLGAVAASNGAAGGLTVTGGGADLLARTGDLRVENAAVAGWMRLAAPGTAGLVTLGSITTGSAAAGNFTPGSLDGSALEASSGGTVLMRGGSLLVDSATTIRGGTLTSASGDILLRAVGGVTGRSGPSDVRQELSVGSVTATGTAELVAAGDMRIGQARTTGNLTLTAGRSITGLGAPSSQPGIVLSAARGVDVRGRNGATLARAALGAVAAGGAVTLENGTVLAETVRLDATAITSGAITAGSGLVRARATNAIGIDSVTAATVDLRTDQAGTSATPASVGEPDAIDPTFGRANLETAQGGVTVTAENLAQLGSVKALTNVTIRAARIDAATRRTSANNIGFEQKIEATQGAVTLSGSGLVRAGDIGAAGTIEVATNGGVEIGRAVSTAGDVRISSRDGGVSGLTNLAGTASATDNRPLMGAGGAVLTASGANRIVSVLAGTDTASNAANIVQLGSVTLGSGASVLDVRAAGIEFLGDVTAGGAIRLTNTGPGGTQIGGTTQTTADFTLRSEEFNRLAAPIITIDSRGRAMTLRDLAIGPNSRSGTLAVTNTQINLLGTGAISVTGAVTGTGTSRTLRIGGSTNSPDASNPTTLASSITVSLVAGEVGTGNPQISWTGGTLDLAAQKIAFGDATLLTGLNGTAVPALLVSSADRLLYTGTSRGTYLRANQLNLTYADYALFQNASASPSQAAGAEIGPAGGTGLALTLRSSGAAASNSFALFGSVNGRIANAAALLPETVIDFSSGNPRIVRINLSNSRINGCGIGAANAGCIAGTPPPPRLTLFDERQIQLFDTQSNPELRFEPLIGTNNEGLIGDLATGETESGDCTGANRVACRSRKEGTRP